MRDRILYMKEIFQDDHIYVELKIVPQSLRNSGLSNLTNNRSADLVYSFPIEAPMRVLFCDIYAAGAQFSSVGTKHYLIAACGMTSFAIAEDTAEQNSTVFVAALMRIWLWYALDFLTRLW